MLFYLLCIHIDICLHCHSCFLDASKAYDRVNHWTLFKKLLKGGISVIIVRILLFWYSKQEICIKWRNETSSCFTISNGVRQGGILSPVLFSIYMDDLSVLLSRSGIGCHIDDLCINHVLCGRSLSNGSLRNSFTEAD